MKRLPELVAEFLATGSSKTLGDAILSADTTDDGVFRELVSLLAEGLGNTKTAGPYTTPTERLRVARVMVEALTQLSLASAIRASIKQKKTLPLDFFKSFYTAAFKVFFAG